MDEIHKYQSWAKLSESSYAVESLETPRQIYNRFAKYVDDNDSFFVITLSRPWSGRGVKQVLDWLTKAIGQPE